MRPINVCHFEGHSCGVCFLWTHSPQPSDCSCSLMSQIDFLNSVIVDLQRRNEELNLKIQRMCEAALNGNEEETINYDRYGKYRLVF